VQHIEEPSGETFTSAGTSHTKHREMVMGVAR
jgi:hypothetical protein